MKHLMLRGNIYYLRRRVPNEYLEVAEKKVIWKSLKTDSKTEAARKAQVIWDNLLAYWQTLADGTDVNSLELHERLAKIARSKGFAYLPADDILKHPTSTIQDRINAISVADGKPDPAELKALLGTQPKPKLCVSRALELFWGYSKDRIVNKSKDQARRWRNPRIKAVANFIEVVGDIPIEEITRDHMLRFRSWWIERIEHDGLTANSANKDLGHLGNILKTVDEMGALNLHLPLSGLSIQEGVQDSRPAFSLDWIKTKLLAPNALDGLNEQARAIFLALINTGARPSEIANLTQTQIVLDHEYPHIKIEPVDRELKSKNAKRIIPLLGCSLEAIKKFPDGFPRYRDKPNLSATLMKYLRENGLLETEKHVVYSLRHSMEERMRLARIDDRIRAELFGHTYIRERYGAPSVKELSEEVSRIAL